jgi:hypothetical protein
MSSYLLPFKKPVKRTHQAGNSVLTSETLVQLSDTGAVNERQEAGALKILLRVVRGDIRMMSLSRCQLIHGIVISPSRSSAARAKICSKQVAISEILQIVPDLVFASRSAPAYDA